MKRIIFALVLLALIMPMNSMGQGATPWNINKPPTTDWWSGNALDTAWRWAKYMDKLVAGDSEIGTGKIWYVDSGVSNAGDGSSWTNAYATLQEAIDASSADGGDNRGDRIKVAQGHAENNASAAAMGADVAGLIIEGLGNGVDMPEITMTDTASTFQISAADVTIYNLRFLGGKTGGTTECIDVTADGDGYRIIGCEFNGQVNTTELLKMITITADADRGLIFGNRFIDIPGGDSSVAVNLEGGSDNSVISYNQFSGDWSSYVVAGTAAQSLNLLVQGNIIHNADADAGYTMSFEATTTGDIIGNKCYANGASFPIVANAMFVAPDNIVMQTEDEETRTYESMMGAFSGDGGTDQGDSIYAAMVLAHTDLDAIISAVGAISGYTGTVSAGGSGTTTTNITGYGTNYFTTDWVLICTYDAGGAAAAPEGEIRDITAYNTSTGAFTHVAFSAAAASGDKVLVARRETLTVDGVALLAAPAAGSLANYIAGTGSLGTDLGAGNSLVDVLGSDGVDTTGADADSLLGAIGTNEAAADTPFASGDVESDRDGNLIKRSEAVIELLTTGTPDKLTAPADTYTILDILGTDGSTTTGAVAGSILAAIGTNEAAADTPFSSSTVEPDVDGNILERLEQIDVDTSAILLDTGTDGVVIADDYITNAKLATDSIGASEMGADSIGSSELASDGIAEIAAGVRAVEQSGNVWYVSDEGDDSTGLSWTAAYNLVKSAEAVASAGDTILIAAGHEELDMTVAKSVTFNLADLNIIGLGEGDQRPLINLTETASVITINAAGITMKNIRIRPSITVTTVGLHIEEDGDGAWIENCAFIDGEETTVDEFVDAILVDSAATDVTIKDCTYYNAGTDGHTDTFVNLAEATIANATIIGCTAYGDFAEAPIWGDSAIPTNLRLENNTVTNLNSGDMGIEFTGAATGVCLNNRIKTNAWATMYDFGSLSCFGNMGTITTDEQAIPIPLSADSSTVTEVAAGSNYERLAWLQSKTEDTMAALGIDITTADVWYVDSVGAADGAGTSWSTAEITLKAAVDDATNSVGAYIFVAPGHAEATITTSIAIDCPGITIVGLGTEALRPTFTFTGQNGDIAHTVADVTWINCLFISSTADTDECMILDGSSDGAAFIDCEWRSTGAFEFVSTVTIGSGCDDVVCRRCKFNNSTVGVSHATAAITNIAGITDGMVVEDCEFFGAWTSGAIYSDDIDTDVMVKNNIVNNTSTGIGAIVFSAAATGHLIDNKCSGDTLMSIIDPGSMNCFGNKISTGTDRNCYDFPLVPGQVYTFSRASAVSGTTTDLWDISGGPIEVISFWGYCTTDFGTPGTVEIHLDADLDPHNNDYQLSTAVDCDAVIDGDRISFDGTHGESVLTIDTGAAAGAANAMLPWFVAEGMLESTQSVGSTGNVTWYMTFRTLTDGVTVTAQ